MNPNKKAMKLLTAIGNNGTISNAGIDNKTNLKFSPTLIKYATSHDANKVNTNNKL